MAAKKASMRKPVPGPRPPKPAPKKTVAKPSMRKIDPPKKPNDKSNRTLDRNRSNGLVGSGKSRTDSKGRSGFGASAPKSRLPKWATNPGKMPSVTDVAKNFAGGAAGQVIKAVSGKGQSKGKSSPKLMSMMEKPKPKTTPRVKPTNRTDANGNSGFGAGQKRGPVQGPPTMDPGYKPNWNVPAGTPWKKDSPYNPANQVGPKKPNPAPVKPKPKPKPTPTTTTTVPSMTKLKKK